MHETGAYCKEKSSYLSKLTPILCKLTTKSMHESLFFAYHRPILREHM